MMLDADVVVVSPASVDRVSRAAGLRERHHVNPSLKGKNFQQPLRPHEHWHVDVSYLNVARTFFSLCGLLDDCNRFLVHGEVRETMTEAGVETILQRVASGIPTPAPGSSSDNGPQLIAKDFKEFVRICGMTHVGPSPSHP